MLQKFSRQIFRSDWIVSVPKAEGQPHGNIIHRRCGLLWSNYKEVQVKTEQPRRPAQAIICS